MDKDTCFMTAARGSALIHIETEIYFFFVFRTVNGYDQYRFQWQYTTFYIYTIIFDHLPTSARILCILFFSRLA